MPPPSLLPARLASLDQFRGYTVLGMFLVNFVGSFAVVKQLLPLLAHHHTHLSYADTIMPQFFLAVGFAYRMTLLKRLERDGAWAAYGHALDDESERAIHDNMAEITEGRTVFIVAHRLPTLRMANRILVFEGGRLIESGSHAGLMAARGRYHALYQAHQILETTTRHASDEELEHV